MEEKIFNGKILQLVIKKIRLPNNININLEVVKHVGAIAVVPILDSERIILIRQFRPVVMQNLWEIPAGMLEEGETLRECVHRELEEEIGYKTRCLRKLISVFPSPGFCEEKIHIFLAKGLKYVGRKKQPDEVLKPKIFTLETAMEMIRLGRIIDSKTIVGLILANTYLNRG